MKVYKNIGLLDLRKATREELLEVKNIENIGTIIVTDEQAALVSSIEQSNIGTFLTLPDGIELVIQNGEYRLTKVMLEAIESQVCLVVSGKLYVEPIGDAALLNKIYRCTINGRIIIMDKDLGVLTRKLQINGDSVIYKEGERLIEGKFILEDNNMYGVTPNTKLVVDQLIALENFDEALFNETFENIRVLKSIIVSKDNIRKVASKIENYLEVEKHVLTPEYQYFDKLTLDTHTITNLKAPKLYVRGKLVIEVSAEMLFEKVTGIICKSLEVNESDYDAILNILEKAENVKIIDPDAITNTSVLKISDFYLKTIKSLSIINYGSLKFDESVSPEELEEKLVKIENYGAVKCPEALYGIIMKKAKVNHGVIKTSNAKKEEDEHTTIEISDQLISNMGTFEL
ncbi:hypothetical protein [Fusibacter bizertensis]